MIPLQADQLGSRIEGILAKTPWQSLATFSCLMIMALTVVVPRSSVSFFSLSFILTNEYGT